MLRNRSQASSSSSQSSGSGHNNNNDDTDGHDEDTVFGDDDLREKKSSRKGGAAGGVVAAPFKPIINFVKERRAINSTKGVLSVLLLMIAVVASMGFSWLVEREERIAFEDEVR